MANRNKNAVKKNYSSKENYKDRKTTGKTGREMSKKQAQEHNKRSDLMSPKDGERNNLPQWYYVDPTLMEQISRFPFSEFAGKSKLYNRDVPSIMVLYYNPGPGVNDVVGDRDVSDWEDAARHAQNQGINLAALKWWSVMTSTSGRQTPYTRNDISMLILSLGELISMYEWIRRSMGLWAAYSLRNRTMPQGLIEACGIDADDLAANHANYRLRINNLVARINQLPIPGNITYLAKCQDMYQHIYTDSPSSMCQFYVQNPATTWVLDETSTPQSGSRLKTVPVCQEVVNEFGRAFTRNPEPAEKKNLSHYIDILEEQINALISSSTFSAIYADLLRLSATNNLQLWSFDTIKEDFVVVPEYNEAALSQIHNTSILPPLKSLVEADCLTALTAEGVPSDGLWMNDVVCEAKNDVVLYNPTFSLSYDPTSKVTQPPTNFAISGPATEIVYDSMSEDPNVDERIDGTRYLVSRGSEEVLWDRDSIGYLQFNFILPDHWCAGIALLKTNVSATGLTISKLSNLEGQFLAYDRNVYSYTADIVKFDWCPQIFNSPAANLTDGMHALFDVNFYTKLDRKWLQNVTDATFIGLFDIR